MIVRGPRRRGGDSRPPPLHEYPITTAWWSLHQGSGVESSSLNEGKITQGRGLESSPLHERHPFLGDRG